MSRSDEHLNDVFARYREALPDPEPSPEFMPELWRKIDARRSTRFQLLHLSRIFLSGAAALWLLMVAVLFLPGNNVQPKHHSYVDALAASNESNSWAYAGVLHTEMEESNPR